VDPIANAETGPKGPQGASMVTSLGPIAAKLGQQLEQLHISRDKWDFLVEMSDIPAIRERQKRKLPTPAARSALTRAMGSNSNTIGGATSTTYKKGSSAAGGTTGTTSKKRSATAAGMETTGNPSKKKARVAFQQQQQEDDEQDSDSAMSS
jgi:hypothetical protein